ncbi:MAG: ABC transporter ATP-binding protein [Fusobacteriaceae bacterium]|nr:ABC transporter ATP-binding protein [Fusobacteriaceae bacterium]
MIVLENIGFRYKEEKNWNLKNINFSISKGQLIVFAGGSGQGKTTLTRLLNGLVPEFFEGEFQGNYQLLGINQQNLNINKISRHIGTVFQDPRSQFFSRNVESELVFSCENLGLPKEEISKRIDYAVDTLDIKNLISKDISSLSSGEKQKLAIASVLTQNPSIIVLDEPSANLDLESISNLKKLFYTLKDEGYTIIVSEHRLFYLKDLMDKMYLIEKGEIIEEFCKKSLLNFNQEAFSKKGLRRFSLPTEIINNPRKESKKTLETRSINYFYGKKQVLKNINFTLNKGEITFLLGKNGSGKTTLAKVLAGLYKQKNGIILLDEKKSKPKDRIKKISLVLQDADYQLFSESVEKEFSLGQGKKEDLEKAIELFDLKNLLDKHPLALSGGQKQRVTIALTLVKNSQLVIFDEPTSGLCYHNMMKVVEFLKILRDEGKSVLVITHDFEFLSHCCQRVLYLKDGEINEDYYLSNENFYKIKKYFKEVYDEY